MGGREQDGAGRNHVQRRQPGRVVGDRVEADVGAHGLFAAGQVVEQVKVNFVAHRRLQN